ncbi:MAG: MCE family protein [Streptosporangiales bacterium]|nr:MCE family protein [Streptosporangiales bacterium]
MVSRRRRRQFLGLAALASVPVVIAAVVAAYAQVFTPRVPATVMSAQAGLLMTPGASVTLHGADVGTVTSVTEDGDQARLGISIDPGRVAIIPANVRASIQAPTVFGPKFLSLDVPARPHGRLRAGQVIEPAQTATELDSVFASLVPVLRAVDPAKLSATLGAISTALKGNGRNLGDFLAELDSYLRQFNPSVPALTADLGTGNQVLRSYASAAPGLLATLRNTSVTSGTLVRQQAQFDAFLLDLTGFSHDTTGFLAANGGSLERTLAVLAPVTGLLARYSPELPCALASAGQINTLGKQSNGKAILNLSFYPGMKPYSYPGDLPAVRAANGPSCYGGPLTPAAAAHWNQVTFDDGASGYFSGPGNLSLSQQPLAVRLFGPSGAAAANRAAGKGK